jgi:hypothetical protein
MKTYTPTDVILNVVSPTSFVLNSWNSMTVTKDEDNYTFSTSSTGHVTRNKNASQLGSISIVLPQSSNENSDMYALMLENPNNDTDTGDLINISVEDLNLDTVFTLLDCVVVAMPESAFDKEAGTITWVVKGNLNMNSNYMNKKQ